MLLKYNHAFNERNGFSMFIMLKECYIILFIEGLSKNTLSTAMKNHYDTRQLIFYVSKKKE